MLLDYNKKVWGLVDKDNGNLLQTDIIEGGQDFAFDVDFDWWEGMDIEWEILADNENLNYEAGPNDEQLHYMVIEYMLDDSYGFVAKDQILWNTKEEALNTKGIKEVLENDKDVRLVEMTIADVVKRSHLDKYELRGPEFWQLERKANQNRYSKTEAKIGLTQVEVLKDDAIDNEIVFISACRPNDCTRTVELIKDLQDMKLEYLGVKGFYEGTTEQSFAVLVPKGDQVTLNKVLFDLGEKYNQDSVGLVRQPLVIEAAPDSPYGTYLDGEKYLIDMDFFSRKDRAKLENKVNNKMKVVLNKDKDVILHIDLREDNYPDLGFADSWLEEAVNHLKNKGIRQPNPQDIKDALIATMDDYTLFGIADFVNGMNIDDRNINAEEGRQIVELAPAELYYMLTDRIYGMNRLHDRIKRNVAEAFTESKVFDRDSDQFYEDTLILDRIFYFLDFIRHEEDSDMAKAIRVKGRIKNYARQAHDKALKQALHDLADSIEGELNGDEFARVADTAAFLHDNYKEQEAFTENKRGKIMRKYLKENLVDEDIPAGSLVIVVKEDDTIYNNEGIIGNDFDEGLSQDVLAEGRAARGYTKYFYQEVWNYFADNNLDIFDKVIRIDNELEDYFNDFDEPITRENFYDEVEFGHHIGEGLVEALIAEIDGLEVIELNSYDKSTPNWLVLAVENSVDKFYEEYMRDFIFGDNFYAFDLRVTNADNFLEWSDGIGGFYIPDINATEVYENLTGHLPIEEAKYFLIEDLYDNYVHEQFDKAFEELGMSEIHIAPDLEYFEENKRGKVMRKYLNENTEKLYDVYVNLPTLDGGAKEIYMGDTNEYDENRIEMDIDYNIEIFSDAIDHDYRYNGLRGLAIYEEGSQDLIDLAADLGVEIDELGSADVQVIPTMSGNFYVDFGKLFYDMVELVEIDDPDTVERITLEELWDFRTTVAVGSIYYAEFQNPWDIDTKEMLDFFEGYQDFVYELVDDGEYATFDEADNIDTLDRWVNMFAAGDGFELIDRLDY